MPLIVVGGGTRSGKSSHALRLAQAYGTRRVFIATGQALDDEMRDRIHQHRADRGDTFETVEEPLEIAQAVTKIKAADAIVIDCLTLWVSNLMFAGREAEVEAMLDSIAASPLPCIAVTNEVGCGVVPENALARRFRDIAGFVNQHAVSRATEAYWMIFGVPLKLK